MPSERATERVSSVELPPAEAKRSAAGTATRLVELFGQLRETDQRRRAEVESARERGERATSEPRDCRLENSSCAVKVVPRQGRYVGLAALKIDQMLPLETFVQTSELAGIYGIACPHIEHYHRQWLVFAATLANLTVPLEILSVLQTTGASERGDRPIRMLFAVVVRAGTESQAVERCQQAYVLLRQMVASSLSDIRVAVADREDLEQLFRSLEGEVIEFCRRRASVPTWSTGRGTESGGPSPEGWMEAASSAVVPWKPSADSWERLLSVLSIQSGPAAMVVHARGMPVAPARLRGPLLGQADSQEALEEGLSLVQTLESIPFFGSAAVLEAAGQQLRGLGGPLIAARIFAVGAEPLSPVLLATIGTSLHAPDAAAGPLPGGVRMKRSASEEILQGLSEPRRDQLYSPEEAIAFLRTPLPVSDGKWVTAVEIRDVSLRGRSGNDAPLGINAACGRRTFVRMDGRTRFEHTYVIGQTGTGKSNLLLHQILHDIRLGCGVGVVDPHGTLIEDVLSRMPADRAEDVLLLDPTDIERPVPFNPLAITEKDALRYRQARDLVVSDLIADVEQAYAANWAHVAGPMWETYMRGTLGLLLGLEPQQAPWIPNLSLTRAVIYCNQLRHRLHRRIKGRDQVIDDFVREAEAVYSSADHSLRNISPYIMSKLNRFLCDFAMRNVICQNRSIDLSQVVNERKILLCYLGRGRFGEHGARLLASTLLSRLRQAVMSRRGAPSAPPFHLFADECQLFADNRLAELLAEARKFNLSLTLAHQHLDQLSPEVLRAILGNVGTLVALRTGASDAEYLAPLLAHGFCRRDLVSLPNYHGIVRSHGCLGTVPFSLEIPPPEPVVNPEQASLIREIARLRHGRDRRVVEKEIADTYQSYTSVE